MELYRTHVVHVALEGEHALFNLVVPDLDQVIVTARHKHWLGFMEVDATHRTYRERRRELLHECEIDRMSIEGSLDGLLTMMVFVFVE